MTTTIAGVVYTKDYQRLPVEAAFERGANGHTWLVAVRAQVAIPALGIMRGEPVFPLLADHSIDLLSEWADKYPWGRVPVQVAP